MDARKFLFDTDMESDCDDAGALAMLLNAHNAGAIELLGIVADAPSACAAPCCEAICAAYGAKLPVGAVKAAQFADSPRFSAYRAHCENMPQSMFYNQKLADGKTDNDYPDAVTLYRELLSEAADGSVTLVCVGFLTAVAQLLQSPPDEASPLDGVELMRRKVARVYTMGTLAADGSLLPNDFNYGMDLEAATLFFDLCPVPVEVCPAGGDVITGATLSSRLPAGHPVRVAYESFTGEANRGRSSWDPLTVHRALHPEDPRIAAAPAGKVAMLTLRCPPQEMAQAIEAQFYAATSF